MFYKSIILRIFRGEKIPNFVSKTNIIKIYIKLFIKIKNKNSWHFKKLCNTESSGGQNIFPG